MNEENAVSFDDFFDAFGTDDGNHTGSDTGTEEAAEKQQTAHEDGENDSEVTQEGESAHVDEETGEDAAEDGGEKNGSESEQTSDMYTIKVNKEERQVTMDELITLAQKGADYDRIKERAEKTTADYQAISQQLAETQGVYDIISMIAKESGVDVPMLLDTFRIRQLMDKDNLSEKEAQERLGRLKAEEKLNAITAASEEKRNPEKERQERAERELKEFRRNFPDVDISSLPVEQMAQDIAAGMTMTQAYLKDQNRRQQEQISKLNAQLKAKEQNSKNRLSSPGSAGDSGSKKAKDQFEDFFAAFG